MNNLMRFIIIIVGGIFLAGCQQSVTRKNTVLMDYWDVQSQKYLKSKISPEEHSKGFQSKYNELFGSQKLEFEKYDDKVLKGLLFASDMMASYSMEPKFVLQMEHIFENLKQRKLDKGECLQGPCVGELFDIYLSFGDFQKAKQLAQQYPDILTDYVPDINEDAALLQKPHKLYKISPDGGSLSLVSVKMDGDKQIVALLNPECDFAQKAMSAISSTPDLREYFEKHALVISPVYSSVSSIVKAAEWNRNNPKLEYFVYLDKDAIRKDWKQFDLRGMTDFYFLKNDQIIHRIPGWPPTEEGFIAEMRKAINQLENGVEKGK